MPTDDRVGLYDDQRLLPPRPEADEGDPEGAIPRRQLGPTLAPRVDLELLSKKAAKFIPS
jgi:hypothetical protein